MRTKLKKLLPLWGLVLAFFFSSNCFGENPSLDSPGKFLNPISDVCWDCLFPIHIAGENTTTKHKDFVKYKDPLCHCPGGFVGIPFAFWEPSRLIEVSRVPYKLLSLGGITLGKAPLKQGTISQAPWGSKSFHHVHYLVFPVLTVLETGIDFVCADTLPIDIGYMSEFDPFWNDDSWSTLLNPETLLFANALAQAACLADCAAASFGKPLGKLFWCAGCQGSLYPFTGHCCHPSGGVQTSSLLAHRLLAKLASVYAIQSFEEGEFCKKTPSRRLLKTAFKTQLTYPKAQTKGPCKALGSSAALWCAGKTYPFGGEDFVYLIWQKKHCCLDPYKITKKVMTGL